MRDSWHNRAVEETADELSMLGFDVEADHIDDYENPEQIGGRVPDVTATGPFGQERVFEVDSSEQPSGHDKRQLQDMTDTGADVTRLTPDDFGFGPQEGDDGLFPF